MIEQCDDSFILQTINQTKPSITFYEQIQLQFYSDAEYSSLLTAMQIEKVYTRVACFGEVRVTEKKLVYMFYATESLIAAHCLSLNYNLSQAENLTNTL